ncbi:hypothetical protein ACFHYQ_03535 [Sphaerimonospora cavernae]|uniref:t-SNARE coiled-coil homology domain-containing protein n=1 Tax=Sphaerimonospora cavernae TaxID=1740611 RepID=A0ABV6TYW4_9ACTN
MVTMADMDFEDRITGLEIDVQSIKILVGAVDNKVERLRLDLQHAQGANVRMIQALRDDVVDFRASVDARFDKVDSRFGEVDAQFAAVNARFDGVDRRFDKMDARFDKMDARFDEVMVLLKQLASGPVGTARG